jgi:predicted nucleotidyltransferase
VRENNSMRIRDFFETKDGWIFAVADYYHPRGIRSLLRYVPDPKGERMANGKRYRKLDFEESYQFLRRKRPEYVQDVHVVPRSDIHRLFLPSSGLARAAEMDPRVMTIASVLREAGLPPKAIGITGSMLLGLHSPSSDIDFVVYGPWWWKAREALSRAKEDGRIQDLDLEMWRRIYSKRKPETGFAEFVLHERRKGNRGMIEGTYFDLLFTRDYSQISPQPPSPGEVLGRRRIRALVKDAALAFDSPAVYRLDHPEVAEILCYSHTYAGQAWPGETVEAEGVLERTPQGQRLVVGTTREARGEWIRSISLLEEEAQRGRAESAAGSFAVSGSQPMEDS